MIFAPPSLRTAPALAALGNTSINIFVTAAGRSVTTQPVLGVDVRKVGLLSGEPKTLAGLGAKWARFRAAGPQQSSWQRP